MSTHLTSALRKHAYVIYCIIIYSEKCSIQIALVKTFNRFPYCTESRKVLSYCTGLRNVLSYCTGLRRGVPGLRTGLLLPGGRHEGIITQPFFFADVSEEFTETIDTLAKEINTETSEDAYISF